MERRDNVIGATVGVVTTLATVLPKVKVLQKAQKGLKKLGKFIASIYVTAGDFYYRRNQVDGWFKNAGYGNDNNRISWTAYKINDGSVDGKKVKGNYDKEFQDMQRWAVARMNFNNPGLGDLWKEFFPYIDMTKPSQSESQPWDALKVLINAFKPGTFNSNTLTGEEVKMIADSLRGGDTTTAGQIIESEKTESEQPLNKMASMFGGSDNSIIIMMVIAAIAFYFLFKTK